MNIRENQVTLPPLPRFPDIATEAGSAAFLLFTEGRWALWQTGQAPWNKAYICSMLFLEHQADGTHQYE